MARRRMLAPINSVKHYVHRAVTSVVTATVLNDSIVDAVVASAVSTPNEVLEGSVVKAVFVELWINAIASVGGITAFNISLEKVPAGVAKMTNAQSLNLMVYPNKKNILYTTQGELSSLSIAQAVPILRQWFAIPKGKQRFGLADELILNVSVISTNDLSVCGFYTYKEYK